MGSCHGQISFGSCGLLDWKPSNQVHIVSITSLADLSLVLHVSTGFGSFNESADHSYWVCSCPRCRDILHGLLQYNACTISQQHLWSNSNCQLIVPQHLSAELFWLPVYNKFTYTKILLLFQINKLLQYYGYRPTDVEEYIASYACRCVVDRWLVSYTDKLWSHRWTDSHLLFTVVVRCGQVLKFCLFFSFFAFGGWAKASGVITRILDVVS